MHRRQLAISIVSSFLWTLAGCGDAPEAEPRTDAGHEEADAGHEEADAGGLDAATAPGDTDAGAAVEPSVAWITEVEPLELDDDRALDFAYQYELVLPDGDLSYSLSLERCSQMAGEEEACEDQSRSNLPGPGYVRWGIDPSQYAVGENRYRFHLELTRGGTLIDEDTVELVVTVTSCGECGPPG